MRLSALLGLLPRLAPPFRPRAPCAVRDPNGRRTGPNESSMHRGNASSSSWPAARPIPKSGPCTRSRKQRTRTSTSGLRTSSRRKSLSATWRTSSAVAEAAVRLTPAKGSSRSSSRGKRSRHDGPECPSKRSISGILSRCNCLRALSRLLNNSECRNRGGRPRSSRV